MRVVRAPLERSPASWRARSSASERVDHDVEIAGEDVRNRYTVKPMR